MVLNIEIIVTIAKRFLNQCSVSTARVYHLSAPFNVIEILSSASSAARLFSISFLRTLILMTQVVFFLLPIMEVVRKCIIFLRFQIKL